MYCEIEQTFRQKLTELLSIFAENWLDLAVHALEPYRFLHSFFSYLYCQDRSNSLSPFDLVQHISNWEMFWTSLKWLGPSFLSRRYRCSCCAKNDTDQSPVKLTVSEYGGVWLPSNMGLYGRCYHAAVRHVQGSYGVVNRLYASPVMQYITL